MVLGLPRGKFLEAMDDDFNTSLALSVILNKAQGY